MHTGSSLAVIISTTLALVLLAPTPARTQTLGNSEVLTQKEANKVRRLLAKGRTKRAFRMLGGGRWCQLPLVEGWDLQKSMAFAADLGVHARRAKKLEQAAHCTLSAIPREGSRHHGAVLFELSLLAKSMGPEALLELLPEHDWATGLEEYVTCSEEDRWARAPSDAVYCALVLGQRAGKDAGGQIARDRLVLNAAQFAPRLAYLRRLPKKDRARLVRFGLRGHREVAATSDSEEAMWASLEASSLRGVPRCSSLSAEAREARMGRIRASTSRRGRS